MAMPRGVERRTDKGWVCGRFLPSIARLIASIFEPHQRMLSTRLPESPWRKLAAFSMRDKSFRIRRWPICCRCWALVQAMLLYSSLFLPIQLLLPWRPKAVPGNRACHGGSKVSCEEPVGVESLNWCAGSTAMSGYRRADFMVCGQFLVI